jgi:hypothetical protein
MDRAIFLGVVFLFGFLFFRSTGLSVTVTVVRESVICDHPMRHIGTGLCVRAIDDGGAGLWRFHVICR